MTIQFSDSVVLPVKDAHGIDTFVGGTRVVGVFDAATRRHPPSAEPAPPNPRVHAQEAYIAYAAQLSTLAPGKRQQVLPRYPARRGTFPHEMSINDLVHAAVPHGFGVMSFAHFRSPAGGRAFLERMYSGDFRPLDFAELP